MSAELQPELPARLTTEEYLRRGIAGEWDHLGRIELIDGEIRQMSPIGPSHTLAVYQLQRLLMLALDETYAVFTQATQPLREGQVPEPDLWVFPFPEAPPEEPRYASPEEILLVSEVADSSLAMDRGKKLRLYASQGVPEYWIVNLRDRVVEVYLEPDSAHQAYKNTYVARQGSQLAPQFAPNVRIPVAEIFKPRLGGKS